MTQESKTKFKYYKQGYNKAERDRQQREIRLRKIVKQIRQLTQDALTIIHERHGRVK